jgi:hypothetical protein
MRGQPLFVCGPRPIYPLATRVHPMRTLRVVVGVVLTPEK